LFVSPAPTAAELAAFYQQAAYYEGSSLGYSDYIGDQARHEQLARRRLQHIERLQSKPGRILDVGCAAGFFLKIAQLYGWEPLGVELSNDMAQMASTLIGRPVAPTLADLDIAPGSLDCITLWEYIEHIPDPREEIERLTALLRAGGVLALSTPNTGYWSAEHQPERWREFKPPAHLGFFTHATLDQLLRGCGLRVVQILHVTARAPSQPYALQRMLALLRRYVGSGEDRRTPIWWSFSLAWRLVEWLSQAGYRLRTPGSDLHIGLEAYAIKP
jgi:2-polyprenyl-3-methyl-5-hydroxy-6-metoxy-1,4-benzoquinol methylase